MPRELKTAWTNSDDGFALTLGKSFIALFLFLLFFTVPLAAKENAVDIALVLDASGSMKKTDPNRMRVEAAKMFVSLLDRKDRVAVVSFGSRAYPVTRLLSLDEQKNETALLKGIDNMVANGKYTNLHDALLQGYEVLKHKNSDNREKHIVLMSDGQMDLGSKERNLRLLEKTLEELTPKLAAENIKVHTIAFTKNSYIPLLKLTAEDTNGQFIVLEDPKSTHQVFENIFVRTKSPEEIPLKEDSFIVDDNIKELTIVASKYKPGSVISLESPNADDISKAHHQNNVKWFSAKKFDLITIKNPQPGYWLIKFSEGGNKAYILSDLSLKAESTKSIAEPGTPFHIRANLSKNGNVVKNHTLLTKTIFKIKVTSPSGAEMDNKLIDDGTEIGSERKDGIYGISYAFDDEGTYKIEIEANSETFDRKKTLFVDIKSFSPKQPFAGVKEPVIAAAEPVQPPQPEKPEEPAPVHDNQAGGKNGDTKNSAHDQTATNKDKHGTDAHATGDAEHDAAMIGEENLHPDENSDADSMHADDGGYSLKEAMLFFVLFNVLLAAGGGGYYYWYRKKQKEKSKDSEQGDAVKNPDAFDENAVDLSQDDNPNEFAEMDDDHAQLDLDKEENLSTASTADASDELSDIDLEAELSSILESEESKPGKGD